MNLSTLIAGPAKPYLEYAWVPAPNTSGQSISANTVTTLTVDTEVSDTNNYGSIASNQITLAAGTYYFNLNLPITASGGAVDLIFGLYNITNSAWVTKKRVDNIYGGVSGVVNATYDLIGQVTLVSSTVFDLRAITTGSAVHGVGTNNFSLATSGADQRVTIKLWKLS